MLGSGAEPQATPGAERRSSSDSSRSSMKSATSAALPSLQRTGAFREATPQKLQKRGMKITERIQKMMLSGTPVRRKSV